MSLGSVWGQATDGFWYQNPIIHASDFSWFLCFDEDDPPELVIKCKSHIRREIVIEKAKEILKSIDIRYTISSKRPSYSTRCFPPKWKFKDAASVFVNTKPPFPVPQIFDSKREDLNFNTGL